MFRPKITLPALAFSVALALPVAAQDAETVVATVNGVDITIGHMVVARATLPQQYQQLPDEVLFSGILDQLIQQAALSDSYEGDLPPRVTLSLENETRSLRAGEVVESILAESVSEEDVQAAYASQYGSAEPADEYNASHILVETEEEAKAIVEELGGGADFAEVAKEKSTGPSGPNGGSVGWFGPGMMVPAFEAAVVELDVGEISEPVQTQFGWHVVTLNEIRKSEVPALDSVREELEANLREQAAQSAIEGVVSKAEVDRSGSEGIDPTIIKDLSIVE